MTWTPRPVFDVVRRVGDVEQAELEATLNCGVGMVALMAPDEVDRAVEVLGTHGIRAWPAGEVCSDGDDNARASLVGQYPGW